MTHKDQIEQLQGQVTDLQSKLNAAEGNATKYQTEATQTAGQLTRAESERDTARTQLQTEQNAHAQTKQTLHAVEQERDGLKAKDKSAGTKAAEQLAANGIAPTIKDTPGNLAAREGDPVALWEAYAAANSTKQAEMRAKYGDRLDAAAAAYDAAQARR